MDPRLRKSRPESTIQNSRTKLGVLFSLAAMACAGAPPEKPRTASTAAPTGEAPAPHLRGSADLGDRGASSGPISLPDPSGTGDVTLGALLAYADERSPVLSVARSTRSRAEAARVAASVLLSNNPNLSFGLGPRLGRAGTDVDIEASLSQQIQIAGERGLRKDAAERLYDLTDAEIEQIRWSVHCDVHAAFHRALVERERVRLAERVVAFQREVLGVVERQIAAGETAPLTLRLAQAEVAQAEQILVGARQALLASKIRLAQLAGWPVETPPTPVEGVDRPQDPPPFEALLNIAREKLPSLRAGAARIRAAEARVDVAAREAWPRPSLGAQYRHEGNPTSEGAYNVVMGILSMPIPAFQLNQGERARAAADVQVAEAELGAAHRLLAGQIAETRSEVVAAAARTRAYGTEILPRFQENLTLLRRSFELGEIDILALSTGRERFLRIQSDALLAQQDYFVALSSLERVVGVDLWHDDNHEHGEAHE
jgi:outer membrane protein, heavy metal efflux system